MRAVGSSMCADEPSRERSDERAERSDAAGGGAESVVGRGLCPLGLAGEHLTTQRAAGDGSVGGGAHLNPPCGIQPCLRSAAVLAEFSVSAVKDASWCRIQRLSVSSMNPLHIMYATKS
eukprot:5090158-Prymnesium_polylepis.2